MKIALVGKKNGFLEKHLGELDEAYPEYEINTFFLGDGDKSMPLNPALKSLVPDLLITEDLIRFEECTLTDAIAYNLLHCRQIHLMTGNSFGESEQEKYLAKQLSLVMYFFCKSENDKDKYMEKYPDIPYLEVIPEKWTDVVAMVI